MGLNLTAAGAEALSAGIGFLGNLGGSVSGGLFAANQAKKNRAFQERMYKQQVKDNIAFWQMQQDYNLPSAQLERLRSAGLSPLLAYGEGGLSGNIAGQAPQSAQAPHGAQAQVSSFNTRFDMANLALVEAQARELNASSEEKLQNIEESKSREANYEYDVMFKRLSQDLELSLKQHNIQQIAENVKKLSMETLWHNELSFESMLSMRQARLYQAKYYDLDASYRGSLLDQGWAKIGNERQRINQGWRQLALFAQQVKNQTNLTNAQIGQIQWSVLSDKAMFLPRFRGLSLDNKLKIWDTHLKSADLSGKQISNFNMMLKNYYLTNTGQESISTWDLPRGLWQGANKPELQDLFVLPSLEPKFEGAK